MWSNPAFGSRYDYTYQGKEWQNNEWASFGGKKLELYDFGARMYDPVLGRWNVPDPAEQYANPYLAMGNSPANQIDPDGTWSGPGGFGRGIIQWIRNIFGYTGSGNAQIVNYHGSSGGNGGGGLWGTLSSFYAELSFMLPLVSNAIYQAELNAKMREAYKEAKPSVQNNLVHPAYSIYVRSFISTTTTGGGGFRGDGRGLSLVTDDMVNASSRVWSKMGIKTSPLGMGEYFAKSDPTVFLSDPPLIDVGEPTIEVTDVLINYGQNPAKLTWDMHHWGKDPLTPQMFTPSLDIFGSFGVTHSDNQMHIVSAFTGNKFPSLESFIEDPLGTRIFLTPAYQEYGGLGNLVGSHPFPLTASDLILYTGDQGEFLRVQVLLSNGYSDTMSPEYWNSLVIQWFNE